MTDFIDVITDAAAKNAVDVGFDAVYRSNGGAGDPENFRCIVETEQQYEPGSFEAQTWGDKIIIEYLIDNLSQEPNKGDTIETLGKTYIVDGMDDPLKDVFFARVIVHES